MERGRANAPKHAARFAPPTLRLSFNDTGEHPDAAGSTPMIDNTTTTLHGS